MNIEYIKLVQCSKTYTVLSFTFKICHVFSDVAKQQCHALHVCHPHTAVTRDDVSTQLLYTGLEVTVTERFMFCKGTTSYKRVVINKGN